MCLNGTGTLLIKTMIRYVKILPRKVLQRIKMDVVASRDYN